MPHRWSSHAGLRAKQIEEGLDLTFSKVFLPWYRSFLKSNGATSLLEVGAGTGHLSLALADCVSEIVAIEPSEGMFYKAVDTLMNSKISIRNLGIEQLEHDRYYDVVLSHMCLHTIQDASKILSSMANHVAPKGVIVFSIPHPCFYNDYKNLFPKHEYQYMKEIHREISFSITLDPDNPITGVPYFHRPISAYIKAVSNSGFMVEDVGEIMPDFETQMLFGSQWETPRYLVMVSRRK